MNRFANLSMVVLLATVACCQPAAAAQAAESRSVSTEGLQASPASLGVRGATADYVLGPGDQLSLSIPGLEDQYNNKIFRIDAGGETTFPLVGRVHASGLTTAALEIELQTRLNPILKDPEVVVAITSFGSQPVSVLGSVRNPGIVQLQGRRTLFEVLSMAGGLLPDAGYAAQVTRSLANGAIPLPNTQQDSKAQVSVASIRLKNIINKPDGSENIEILPGDTISVPKAGVVYVVGSVAKPGGFTLDENESLSALQAVSLAEGLQTTSASSKAKILHAVPGSATRTEIPVNLNRLMAGKSSDMQLYAGDILFVPTSNAKKVGFRTMEAIIQAAIYVPVYGGF